MNKLTLQNKFQEDISVLAAGTNLVGHSCVVYDITIAIEADGDAIISFADGLTYTTANRVLKAITSAEKKTIQLTFPQGKIFSTGLSVTSNVASVDVAVTYE